MLKAQLNLKPHFRPENLSYTVRGQNNGLCFVGSSSAIVPFLGFEMGPLFVIELRLISDKDPLFLVQNRSLILAPDCITLQLISARKLIRMVSIISSFDCLKIDFDFGYLMLASKALSYSSDSNSEPLTTPL